MNFITTNTINHISIVSLNRPNARNAYTSEMIEELCSALVQADEDSNIRCIIITGEGESFCAGGDVKEMLNRSGMFAGEPAILQKKYSQGIQNIGRVFESISTPTIAKVKGAAIGAGCDLACMCDLRVGDQSSVFAESFAKLNLVPGDGGSYFLQRVVGFTKAMQMTLTCEQVKARDAFEIGLLNYYVDDIDKFTLELADKISSLPPQALQYSKRALVHAYRNDLSSNLDLLSSYQGILQNMHDHQIALDSIKNKKPTKFLGQ